MDTKRFVQELQEKRESLTEQFLSGNSELDLHKELTSCYDSFFMQGFESLADLSNRLNSPFAMVALGGYGREEQAPYSDIDILFLFEKKIEKEADKIIREMLYPLWDANFSIGHSTRTIDECIKEAKSELFNLTAMLDARFICGFSPLYFRFIEKFRKYYAQNARAITKDIISESSKRARQYGDSEYLLEPDIKNGIGGLRDYHLIRWIAKVHFDFHDLKDFVYYGYLSEYEYPEFMEAYEFLNNVRNHLHIMTGRKIDKLHFEHQVEIASLLNYRGEGKKKAVEVFLGDLHKKMSLLKELSMMVQNEAGRPKKLGIKRLYEKKTNVNGLQIRQSLLDFESPESIITDPSILMAIFKESGSKKVVLSHEAQRLVSEFSHLVDDSFRKRDDTLSVFEKIMMMPKMENHPLDLMLNSGMLAAYIPEFGNIIDRVQYNDFHIYPVGRHSIRAVQALHQIIADSEEIKNYKLYQSIYSEIKPKKVLLWAILLHDIGKGVDTDDHSEAGSEMVKSILKRFGFKKEYIDTISFLVKKHLDLIKIATRRDINDEETIVKVAMEIKSPMRLKMLFLLTIADSLATGPKAWNEWNENLLVSLFLKTLKVLEKGTLSGPNAIFHLEKKMADLRFELQKYTDEPDSIISLMPASYIFELPVEDMLEHANLYIKLKSSDSDFFFHVEKDADSDLRRVFICGKDKPGFFASAAGCFTINNMDILDARAFGWNSKIALSIFTLSAPLDTIYEERIWDKFRNDLLDVVNDKTDLYQAVMSRKEKDSAKSVFEAEDRVRIDNSTSSFYSIIEIFTNDYPGLLYDLSFILYRCGLDIKSAKIATKVSQVVDIFYVSEINNGKISDQNIDRVKNQILVDLSEVKEAV